LTETRRRATRPRRRTGRQAGERRTAGNASGKTKAGGRAFSDYLYMLDGITTWLTITAVHGAAQSLPSARPRLVVASVQCRQVTGSSLIRPSTSSVVHTSSYLRTLTGPVSDLRGPCWLPRAPPGTLGLVIGAGRGILWVCRGLVPWTAWRRPVVLYVQWTMGDGVCVARVTKTAKELEPNHPMHFATQHAHAPRQRATLDASFPPPSPRGHARICN
jgi:hypothetical protein